MEGLAGFDVPSRKARVYASAADNMLRNPDPILNRAVFISGVKGVTQIAILEALEAEVGGKFTIEHVDLKEIKKEA
ncbi:hypothetical protein AOQ84DRAFT_228459 [Glonium stellatum]|uniref:Uncharacterized protein n=1 Tax=Glonium stellatum TaxID=574774 RepID=A0A8E2F812_9PEZI|nr:hypothetical protein AOQ84DRAFT_228459 [Glonium stellatum]